MIVYRKIYYIRYLINNLNAIRRTQQIIFCNNKYIGEIKTKKNCEYLFKYYKIYNKEHNVYEKIPQ
jgi:hypothetical protein